MLPKSFCWFGYLSGFSGLVMGVIFFPVYLQLVLIWSGWLAVLMWRQAGRRTHQHQRWLTRAINRKS